MTQYKVRWPQACRAQSAAAAYKDALDLFARKPVDVAIEMIREKIKKKEQVWEAWRGQTEQGRADTANEEYKRQASITDENES